MILVYKDVTWNDICEETFDCIMSYMCCDVWERNVRFLINQRNKENNRNMSFMKRLVFGSCAWRPQLA